MRDTSLKVPHGESGIIVDAKVFTRENGDELSPGVNQAVRIYIAQKRKISVGDKMAVVTETRVSFPVYFL